MKSLNERHLRFRDLIDKNNQMLELMAEAEEMLSGEFIFDMQYLKTLATQLASASRAVVYDLNAIADNRYQELVKAVDEIEDKVRATIEAKTVIPRSELVIPLSKITGDSTEIVGEKTARLGELSRRKMCRVPDGFAVSAFAFQQVLQCIAEQDEMKKWLALTHDDEETRVDEASSWLQLRTRKVRIPDKLARAIRDAALKLQKRNPNCLLALRSSALGEDGTLSFAGQYKTLLGITPERVIPAYIEVLASVFASGAMKYRRTNRLPPAGGAMAVGCLTLINARAAGVLYTLDPNQPQRNVMVVTASYGLGITVVEGTDETDQFAVSRKYPYDVLSSSLGRKHRQYVANDEQGLRREKVEQDRSDLPAINQDELKELCETSLRIERFMKCAQDIEWAFDQQGQLFILQTRPLRLLDERNESSGRTTEQIGAENTILMQSRGEVACRGVAHGRVVLVDDTTDLTRLPDDAVLVARYSKPALSEALAEAKAVITDIGTATGHLATLARELRVPAILDTEIATQVLKDGQEVTVDAEENVVYLGLVQDLIHNHLLKSSTYEDKPEFRLLRKMLRMVTPLHFKDPQSPDFNPANCSTYHDVIRFAHEKAVERLTRGYSIQTDSDQRSAYHLDLPIPLDLVVIDLDGGPERDARRSSVGLDQVTSRPLACLLEGLCAEGVWNSDPADMDLSGFMASATRSFALTGPAANAPQPNLAIVNTCYLNLNLKLGYHFNIVDCYLSEKRNDNFIYFRFAGGVTEMTRRNRRAEILQRILETNDFVVDRKEDLVIGRIKKISAETMHERLQMVGRLIGFTRQLDIFLRDDSLIKPYVNGFINGKYHPSQFNEAGPLQRGNQMNQSGRVMVLDDEEIVCERLKTYLEKQNYQVETFTVSQQAMERLQQEKFDVVVTDLKMKAPNGLEILRFIRSQDQGTQVVMITGYATMEALREAEYTDVVEFICKPFQMDTIGSAVKKAAKKAKKFKKRAEIEG